jgi:hypothetical protein
MAPKLSRSSDTRQRLISVIFHDFEGRKQRDKSSKYLDNDSYKTNFDLFQLNVKKDIAVAK